MNKKGDLKLFSSVFGSSFTSSGNSFLAKGTNIYGSTGSPGKSSSGDNHDSIFLRTIDTYSEFIELQDRLRSYRTSGITETILDLYYDAVMTCIDVKTDKLVEITSKDKAGKVTVDDKSTKAANDILLDLDIVDLIRSNLKDMIYYGSSASLPKKVRGSKVEGELEILELVNSQTTLKLKNKDKYVILGEGKGRAETHLFRFSYDDLELDIDKKILEDIGESREEDEDEDPFIKGIKGITGTPLYLSVEMKVKDYILKDTILSILSIMKAIEQETYSIDVQRLSDMDSVVELCERIKNLLVNRDDINIISSSTLSVSDLIIRLLDNKRVIPNVSSNLSSLQEVAGTKLQEKIDALTNSKESVRDELLTTIGFPIDLFAGRVNKWEVGRQSDRYNSKVIGIKNAVITSVLDILRTSLELKDSKDLENKTIEVLFIKDTPAEIANYANKVQAQTEVLAALQQVIETSSRLSTETGVFDKSVINQVLKGILSNIDSRFTDAIDTNKKPSRDII